MNSYNDSYCRAFAIKDDFFCLFKGTPKNLMGLRQQYELSKSVNEVLFSIETYKTFKDRVPYPPSQMVGHLEGQFAFVIFDRCTRTIVTATVSTCHLRKCLDFFGIFFTLRGFPGLHFFFYLDRFSIKDSWNCKFKLLKFIILRGCGNSGI